mmetsp:Transcript_76669/g.197456  ORF Transcript_76669/g.197456 Transcript_76669/m.197456 type:complete len:533 (-) Transcript_76669:346-1944(-)
MASQRFQATFNCNPNLSEESRGPPPEFRFCCLRRASPGHRAEAASAAAALPPSAASAAAAPGAALAPAAAAGQEPQAASAPAAPVAAWAAAAEPAPESAPRAVFSVVYERGAPSRGKTTGKVLDLLTAFEQAPRARGVLEVQEIRRLTLNSECANSRRTQWKYYIKDLQQRAEDKNFPKPNLWNRDDLGPGQQRERQEVWWHLLSMSRRHVDDYGEGEESCPDVWTAPVFHGCSSEEVAESIMKTGFAGNVQKTKGWFGEGIYTSTSAPYALRYSFNMTDFWDRPGQTGVVVAGRAAFCQVYPVTQADNDAPLRPGMKGKRIASAKEASGCDAHFVCVRRHPPNDDHDNWTYHACAEGERPDGTELVVNQEVQYLPEYVVKVRVRDDPDALRLCEQVREAAGSWGRPPGPAAGPTAAQLAAAAPTPTAATASPSPASAGGNVAAGAPSPNGCYYKERLHALVSQRLKRDLLPPGFIKYTEDWEEGEFISTVTVRWATGTGSESESTFRGNPQPRKVAAQHDAARVAWETLEA